MTDQVTVADLTFDVLIDGPEDGPAVVLLHGFPETSATWTHVLPDLVAAGHRVVAPNQRGYSPGARPTDIDAYGVDVLVADVLGIVDALKIDRFHLVGHDWGAAVAWALAAWHRERLLSLTALSVPHLAAYNHAIRHDPDARERASYIALLRQEGRAEDLLLEDGAARLRAMYGDAVPPEQVDTYLAQLQDREALTAALAWYRAMTPSLADLPAVDVPTTYLWSDQDLAIGQAGADACHEHVTADFEYVVLEGITHWIPEQAPDAVVEAVLGRIRRAG
ncbi:alpha/beta fold hydrolase [Aeromicrobium sp. CTD01-1L150]|uniref:alpha/beta fold hydrolase n=1 Tax=Aeromicrobium sp. CTD01-1L150 TaxID=3341830 RepID=UPI0035C2663E